MLHIGSWCPGDGTHLQVLEVWAAVTQVQQSLHKRLLTSTPTSAQAPFIQVENALFSHKVQELCLLLTSQLEASPPSCGSSTWGRNTLHRGAPNASSHCSFSSSSGSAMAL